MAKANKPPTNQADFKLWKDAAFAVGLLLGLLLDEDDIEGEDVGEAVGEAVVLVVLLERSYPHMMSERISGPFPSIPLTRQSEKFCRTGWKKPEPSSVELRVHQVLHSSGRACTMPSPYFAQQGPIRGLLNIVSVCQDLYSVLAYPFATEQYA